MPRNRPVGQYVLLGDAAQIVDHDWDAGQVAAVGEKADGVAAAGHLSDHDVAGLPGRKRFRRNGKRQSRPMMRKNSEVRYTTMVDIRIGAHQSPAVRILFPVPLHIFMHLRLQIAAISPQTAYDDIRTGPLSRRRVAIRVRENVVRRIVRVAQLRTPLRRRASLAGATGAAQEAVWARYY